jgi:hypothetical protein
MAERLRIDIDSESYRRLLELAAMERRPIGWQAEWMLIRAIHEHWSPGLRPESVSDELESLESVEP